MPSYDYYCADNGRTVAVRHRMSQVVQTWGELCEIAEANLGDTPPGAAVAKILTPSAVVKRNSLGSGAAPSTGCGMGGCGAGMCQMQ